MINFSSEFGLYVEDTDKIHYELYMSSDIKEIVKNMNKESDENYTYLEVVENSFELAAIDSNGNSYYHKIK